MGSFKKWVTCVPLTQKTTILRVACFVNDPYDADLSGHIFMNETNKPYISK